MEKKIRLSLEEEEEDKTTPLDFAVLHKKHTKNDKFCWGCEHTLYAGSKNENIQAMYNYFRNKKGTMTDYKIAEHIANMKKELYPNDDDNQFLTEDVLHHLNNHMFDLFNELHRQVEKCNTFEAQLEKYAFRFNKETLEEEPDHDVIKSRDMIVKNKLVYLKELHKYRDNKTNA
jgi:hypothetical protein